VLYVSKELVGAYVSNVSGVVEDGDFRLFYPLIFVAALPAYFTFTSKATFIIFCYVVPQ